MSVGLAILGRSGSGYGFGFGAREQVLNLELLRPQVQIRSIHLGGAHSQNLNHVSPLFRGHLPRHTASSGTAPNNLCAWARPYSLTVSRIRTSRSSAFG